ncbi:MAG: hypothetical protein PHY29_03155 [Syntrophales bacterium]|nr:hypothetical protein [Syntrophales bacterium]
MTETINIRSVKVFFMLVVALFMLSFTGTAVSGETGETELVIKVAGTLVDVNLDDGKVVIREVAGKTTALAAESGEALSGFDVGDHVVIEYTSDMMIKSITKKGKSRE